MSWARVDDGFALHPKLLEAGLEARGLDIAAICYSSKYGTDGFIPDSALTLLATGAKSPRAVAQRLADVGRWHRDNEKRGWWIHDFLDYNPSKEEADQRRAKRADAGAIGGKRSRSSSVSKTQANASSKTEANALVVASTKSNPVPSRPVKHSSSSDLQERHSERLDDERNHAPSPVEPWLIAEASFEIIAKRQLDARLKVTPPIGDQGLWLKSAVTKCKLNHAERAQVLLVAEPKLTPRELADRLEPVVTDPRNPLAGTQVAARAIAEEQARLEVEMRETDVDWDTGARNFNAAKERLRGSEERESA